MKKTFRFILAVACWAYLTLLFGWLAVYLTTGERNGAIAIVNLLAVYLFLPLPLVILGSIFLRRASLLGISGIAVAVFLWIWGSVLLPQPTPVHAVDSLLTVMTFNVLGWQENASPQIEVIRAEGTDVVLLQELNLTLATAVQRELLADYPFQVLDPQEGVTGMGVISKFPIHLTGERLPLNWVSTPQVLDMDWKGREVTLVNFHAIPTTSWDIEQIQEQSRYRVAQAQALVELSRRSGPLIVAGDANDTPLGDAYRTIAGELNDAWIDAGFGLGHTFPGSDLPGSSRPRLWGWPVPKWLMRIDYIFYSPPWEAAAAHTARFDGVSDHRGVVASLEWKGGK